MRKNQETYIVVLLTTSSLGASASTAPSAAGVSAAATSMVGTSLSYNDEKWHANG